jgi:hypothetical protein
MGLATIVWIGMVFVREKTEERGEPLSDGMEGSNAFRRVVNCRDS